MLCHSCELIYLTVQQLMWSSNSIEMKRGNRQKEYVNTMQQSSIANVKGDHTAILVWWKICIWWYRVTAELFSIFTNLRILSLPWQHLTLLEQTSHPWTCSLRIHSKRYGQLTRKVSYCRMSMWECLTLEVEPHQTDQPSRILSPNSKTWSGPILRMLKLFMWILNMMDCREVLFSEY